jgi:hypothetical protein
MALDTDLMGLGMAAVLAARVGHQSTAGIVGIGTSQAGAKPLVTSVNILTPTAGQTAYTLPTRAPPTLKEFYIFNAAVGATAALIYPPLGGATLNGSTSAAVSVAQNTGMMFMLVAGSGGASPQWVSAGSAGGGGGGSLTLTDGTTTVAGTTQITVTGGTVGGASPDATLTIAGGGLTGFTASLNTTPPNDIINVSVLAASGGTTKQDISLVPKGSSDAGYPAFQLSIPDNTTAGGNKRGVNAVDLQQSRTDPSQVASGRHCFVAGRANTASASGAVAMGEGCVASGAQSVAMGDFSVASGQPSFAWGDNCTASAPHSVALCVLTIADAESSIALGNGGWTRGISYSEVFGSRNTNAGNPGGFQRGHYTLWANPADATPTVLTSDGAGASATNQVALPNGANSGLGASYVFKGQIVAVDVATGHTSAWDFKGAIKQLATAASTALVAAVTATLIAQDAALSTTAVAITADTTNGALSITVTGIAATNIQWMCDVQTSETTY